nr:unknown [Zea mays]
MLLERVVAEACRASSAGRSVAADSGEDAGVDVKADEFIARFYAQMKLQRQISWLQYNEMMERSIS